MSDLKPWDPGYMPPKVTPEIIEEKLAEDAEARARGAEAARKKRQEVEQQLLAINPDPTEQERREFHMAHTEHGRKILAMTEANLSPEQKLEFQSFAVEYLRHFDAPRAYMAATGKSKPNYKRAREMLYSPYTQHLIKQVTEALEEEQLITRKDVLLGLWREANSMDESANGGSRVRALMGLARIKKMDVHTQKVEVKQTHNVMHVPMVDNDAWAMAAEESQRQLKHDVRN